MRGIYIYRDNGNENGNCRGYSGMTELLVGGEGVGLVGSASQAHQCCP